MFVVTVKFKIKNESLAEFREAILKQSRDSLETEAGCHQFDVCFQAKEMHSCFLYEKYSDASAFESHLNSQHFESFNAVTQPWVQEKTVETWVEHTT